MKFRLLWNTFNIAIRFCLKTTLLWNNKVSLRKKCFWLTWLVPKMTSYPLAWPANFTCAILTWKSILCYTSDAICTINRLFSCGTNKEGDSYVVEWNESEGAVKRTYNGLGKQSVEVVQFDTTKNRFLAAGDEFVVKFWDMDNVNLLTTTDADGGLQVLIRFFHL